MKYSVLGCTSLAISLTTLPALAAEPVVQVGVERVAGISNASIDPDNGAGADFTFFSLGGPSLSPLVTPRVAADYLIPMGLTLGLGLGYMHGSISDDQNNNDISLSFYAITPRVGYRAKLSPMFDLIPRLGLTFAGGSITEPDDEVCTFNGVTSVCTPVPGDELSFTATALSPELVGVLRATSSFNVLAGFAVEPLLSASGENKQSTGGSGSTIDTEDYKGSMLSLSLWFGLSGYL